MAGSSMTFTYDNSSGFIRKVIADWVSDDTTGDVTGTSTKITGTLLKGVTDPGSPAPDSNYDITITDEESVDVLGNVQSNLTNRHATTTEEVYFLVKDAAVTPLAQSVQPVVCDKLTFAVTNAGNSKQGQIIIYYQHYQRYQ